MAATIQPADAVREALQHLYDPTTLAALPLAMTMVEHRVIRSPENLYDYLLASIKRLCPPDGAPNRSHGWRCYRYLQRRYVDCLTTEAVAQELGVSVRHAARIQLDALDSLTRIVLPPPKPSNPGTIASRTSPLPMSSEATQREINEAGAPSRSAEFSSIGHHLPTENVDVVEVTRGIAETLRPLSTQHQVRLELSFPVPLPAVRANRVGLRQVILNVLLHLIQSAPTDVVRVEGAVVGDEVRLDLRVQAERTPHISVDDDVMDGSSVLDAAKRFARLQQITLEQDELTPGRILLKLFAGATRTILLVDDNPDVGELFRRHLAKSPYRVIHCRTADRALRQVQLELPDVIILDIILPTTDGWELLTALRTAERSAALPVIVCSVMPDREVALSVGAADFLSKPVSRKPLLNILDRLFEASDKSPVLR